VKRSIEGDGFSAYKAILSGAVGVIGCTTVQAKSGIDASFLAVEWACEHMRLKAVFSTMGRQYYVRVYDAGGGLVDCTPIE
jgi:hypothetical protein